MDCLLESDVGVGNQECAEDSVHDGVERTGGERSDGQGDETDADGSKFVISKADILPSDCQVQDEPLESPVVATLAGVRLGDLDRVIHCCSNQYRM